MSEVPGSSQDDQSTRGRLQDGGDVVTPVLDVAAALEAMPDGVQVADGVDLDSQDPAYHQERGRRLCVAERRAGGRCQAVAPRGSLLCNAHAGKLDSSAGGRTLAQKRREARENAETLHAWRRLGTRSLVAAILVEEASDLRATVRHLLRRGAAGDIDAAKALVPWLNQALGNPTERVEHTAPSSLAELEGLPTDQLEALVAEGRQQRMRLVEPPSATHGG